MPTSSTPPTRSDSESGSGRALGVALLALAFVLLAPVALMGLWMAVVGVAAPSSMAFPMMDRRTPLVRAPLWFAVVGLLGQLLWVAALLAVGYLLYRAATGGGNGGRGGRNGGRGDPALEELRLAYARGEVSDEEYERRRERLREE